MGQATSWAGEEVMCKACRLPMEYQYDREHDGGDCEIFKCANGHYTHVELPD